MPQVCADNNSAPDVIADFLPAMRSDIPAPVLPPRLINLPRVIFEFWFAPRRVGPRLSAMPWFETMLIASLCFMIFFSAIAFHLVVSVVNAQLNESLVKRGEAPISMILTWDESARLPFTALITALHMIDPNVRRNSLSDLLVLAIVPTVLIACAVVNMFFTAAGESLRSLFSRSLRVVIWSCSILLPASLLLFAWIEIRHGLGLPAVITADSDRLSWAALQFDDSMPIMDLIDLIPVSVFIAWWVLLFSFAGMIYAGPAVGPGWTPERPVCCKCGYILSGLPVSGGCPECNTPNETSLARQRAALRAAVRNAFRRAPTQD